jgi:hypothetical protein
MNYRDFKEFCFNHLSCWSLYSEPVTELNAMIVAHESLGCKFIRQIGGGPARSWWQIEKPTHDDAWDRSRSIRKNAAKAGIKRDWSKIEDPVYALFVARHIIMLDPKPVPTKPADMARWCKEKWNGGRLVDGKWIGGGKATPEKYLKDYHAWQEGKL